MNLFLTEPIEGGLTYNVAFGRIEDLDVVFDFLTDPEDVVDYPFGIITWFEKAGVESEETFTLLTEDDLRQISAWSPSALREFEANG